MKTLKNWVSRQDKIAKIALSLVALVYVLFAVIPNIGLLPRPDIFAGRVLGELIGTLLPPLLFSVPLSAIIFFIFRNVAEEHKNYFPYFVYTFVIVSIFTFLGMMWFVF